MLDVVTHPVFVLLGVIVIGSLLGKIKIGVISLDAAAIIFVGLAAGYFGLTTSSEFRSFGLVLFIYSVGLQAGPSFSQTFKRNGFAMIVTGVIIAAVGLFSVVMCENYFGFNHNISLGLLTGAMTTSPGLAVALETNSSPEVPAAYGLAYCVGLICVVMFFKIMPVLLRFNPAAVKIEEEQLDSARKEDAPPLVVKHFKLTKKDVFGKAVKDILSSKKTTANLTRLLRDKASEAELVTGATLLEKNDKFRVVGLEADVDVLIKDLGKEIDDHIDFDTTFIAKTMIISNQKAVGRTKLTLDTKHLFNVKLVKIIRHGHELPMSTTTKLRMGDLLQVVGDERSLENLGKFIGDDMTEVHKASILPIFLGISIGFLLGQIVFYLPWVGNVKLGVAGGVLLSGLVLGYLYKTGPIIWDIPSTTNTFIRELGLAMFLAVVGVQSGSKILTTFSLYGTDLILASLIVAISPMLISFIVSRYIFKVSVLHSFGAIAGGITSTPGLASASSLTSTAHVATAYAAVYPTALVSTIIIVKFFELFT